MTKHTLYGGPCDGMELGFSIKASSVVVHRDAWVDRYRYCADRGLFVFAGSERKHSAVADAGGVDGKLAHLRRVLKWIIAANVLSTLLNLSLVVVRMVHGANAP